MDEPGYERRDRVLLRPWLENMLETGNIPGLEWYNKDRMMFKVPWKHRSKKDWSFRHSSVFLEWARNTGRYSEGDPPPYFAQLKTRLRCAFNKAPDIEEMKDFHARNCEEPYKVYRFTTRKDGVKASNRRAVPGWSLPRHLSSQRRLHHHRHHHHHGIVAAEEIVDSDDIDDDSLQYSYVPADVKPHWLLPTSINADSLPSVVSHEVDVETKPAEGGKASPSVASSASAASGSGGGARMIPLSVEMLSDSDDEDRKPPVIPYKKQMATSVNRVAAASNIVAGKPNIDGKSAVGDTGGKSKLLMLQMASVIVEAAAAAASQCNGDKSDPVEVSDDVIIESCPPSPADEEAVDLSVHDSSTTNTAEVVDLSSPRHRPVTRVLPPPRPVQQRTTITPLVRLSQPPGQIPIASPLPTVHPSIVMRLEAPSGAVPLIPLVPPIMSVEVAGPRPTLLPHNSVLLRNPSSTDFPRSKTPVKIAHTECIADKTADDCTSKPSSKLRDSLSAVDAIDVVQLEQLQVQEDLLIARARQLLNKEAELNSLEQQLKAKQEALYLRERYLCSEQLSGSTTGTSATPVNATCSVSTVLSVGSVQPGLDQRRVALSCPPQLVLSPKILQSGGAENTSRLTSVDDPMRVDEAVKKVIGGEQIRQRVLPIVTAAGSASRWPCMTSLTTSVTTRVTAVTSPVSHTSPSLAVDNERVLPPVNLSTTDMSRDQLRRQTEQIYLRSVLQNSSLADGVANSGPVCTPSQSMLVSHVDSVATTSDTVIDKVI